MVFNWEFHYVLDGQIFVSMYMCYAEHEALSFEGEVDRAQIVDPRRSSRVRSDYYQPIRHIWTASSFAFQLCIHYVCL